jgi:hypothetical protein
VERELAERLSEEDRHAALAADGREIHSPVVVQISDGDRGHLLSRIERRLEAARSGEPERRRCRPADEHKSGEERDRRNRDAAN